MGRYATAELLNQATSKTMFRFPIQEMDRIALPKDTYADEGFIKQEPGELQVRVTTPIRTKNPVWLERDCAKDCENQSLRILAHQNDKIWDIHYQLICAVYLKIEESQVTFGWRYSRERAFIYPGQLDEIEPQEVQSLSVLMDQFLGTGQLRFA